MKKLTFLNLLILTVLSFSAYSQGGNCSNLNFNLANFTNWQCYAGSCNGGNVLINPSPVTSGRHTIMDRSTLILTNQLQDEHCSLIPKVPAGFSYSARVGNSGVGSEMEAIEYTMNVDNSNSLLIVHFAWVLEYVSTHAPSEQPMFSITIKDSTGMPISGLPCSYLNFTADSNMPNLACEFTNLVARNWTTVAYSLDSLIGQTVKIYFETRDCTSSGHFGYAYVAAECRSSSTELHYCNGTASVSMRAPNDFVHYKWTRSTQSGWVRQTQGGNTYQNINVTDPINAEIFTCELTSELGCTATVKFIIKETIINPIFQYGVKDTAGGVDFVSNNGQNWYDTCTRTATFVDFSTTENSKKRYIRWRADGLNNFFSEDSMYTYTFPNPDTPTRYLIRLEVMTEDDHFDSSRCSRAENYITIYPSPKIEIVGDTQICEGDTMGLKAIAKRGASFISYQWSDNLGNDLGTADSISITTSGTYYVEAVEIGGCIARDTIIVMPPIPIMAATITPATCHGFADGRISHGPISGGQAPYDPMMWFYRNQDGTMDTLDKQGSQLGKSYIGLKAGTYVFYALDARLCLLIGTVEVLQPDSLELDFAASTIIPTNVGIDNGKITLQAKGGIAPYRFRILEGDGGMVISLTNSVENLAQGTYFAEITDANGCITIDSVVVGLDTTPIISIRPISSNPTLKLYPNPVQHTLYIESSEIVEQVSIYDISGRIVRANSIRPKPSQEINVSNLANGIYLVKVKTAAGEAIKRIVVSD